MGMTIDEALEILDNIPTIGEQVDALEMAIDTMRKYQKIEQIVKEWEFDHESMFDSMEKISGVMEDGQTSN